jgi:hypothetical protein
MDIFEVPGEKVLFTLSGYDVLFDTVQETLFDPVESNWRRVPWACRRLFLFAIGYRELSSVNLLRRCDRSDIGRSGLLVLHSRMFFEVIGITFCGSLCSQFVLRRVTLVVVLDNLDALWRWVRLPATKKEGALRYVPPLQCPILLDDLAVQVG